MHILNYNSSFFRWGTHISPGVFFFFFCFVFSFFQNVNVLGCYGVKGQSMAQNDKKFCLSHFVSQEPYIVWLSFMVHRYKMMIYPGVFFFHFLKILIFRVSVVKGQKIIKMKKNFFFLSHSISQEPYIMCLSFLVEKSKMMISPGIFFIFSKFLFFRWSC